MSAGARDDPARSASGARPPGSPDTSSPANTLKAQIPSDTRYLHVVTNLARNAARAAGLSEADAEKLALATDEAVTNVIEHAYRGDSRRTVELAVTLLDDGVEIHIVHDGDPLDEAALPKSFDPADLIRRGRKGGLGIVLMRKLVDRVDFRATDEGRNECCLWKGKGPDDTDPEKPRAAGG